MLDYKHIEGRAKELETQILALAEKADATDADRDRVMSLTGEMHALEDVAAEIRDKEIEELRAQVAAGQSKSLGGTQEDAVKRAYLDYLRTGQIMDASLSTTDANGGYIVPEPVHAELIEKVRKEDPVFGRATLFRMTGDTVMTLPYKSAHGVVTNATETGARSEQNAPTFTAPTLTCYDYYTDQRATQQVLDSVEGIEDMLLGWIYEDVQEQAGADAVSGNGSTKIEGLFAGTSKYTTKLSGSAGALVNTNFLPVLFALPVKFRKNSVWLMNGTTLATVAAFAYPSTSAINPLATQNESTGEWMILGKPVLETDSAPAIGASNYPVALADIQRAYAVGIHRNTSVLRDPYTATPYVRFYGLARMGGCAWDYQAAILLKSNNS